MDVRDGLKKALDDSGMKKCYVAKRANIDPAKLSDIVNKRRRLDANVLFDLCEALGKRPGEIYELALDSPGQRVS